MSSSRRRPVAAALFAVIFCLAIAWTRPLWAASYLPISDAELARRAPIIARATVVGQELRHESLEGDPDALFTRTTLRVDELIKAGDQSLSPGDLFRIELPGGRDGSRATWIPGTPAFADGGEVVLFLSPRPGRAADYTLTEFGLSKFDILSDRAGRGFAVRPVFSDDEDDAVSSRRRPKTGLSASATPTRTLRDAVSFLASLRAAAGGRATETVYDSPKGDLALDVPAAPSAPSGRSPLWVNIGGVEGAERSSAGTGTRGLSPAALVSASGTQSGLSDGSNGLPAVQNGASAWAAVAGATVRYSTTSGTGPVVVHLDVTNEPSAWSDALPCGTGGVIGYGGPGTSSSAPPFKGSSGYYAPSSGNVWMRKVTGGCYSSATFRSAVLHELGHTLGLGHSDQGVSVHSTTAPSDWNAAVMHSVIPAANPSVPQTDDIQAIQYYYGALGTEVSPPSAAFSLSPDAPIAGQPVAFSDASAGGPTAWLWSFGDGTSATAQNPLRRFRRGNLRGDPHREQRRRLLDRDAKRDRGDREPSRRRRARRGVLVLPHGSGARRTRELQDASAGAPVSWAWSFGDPLSGSANFSSLANPVHTFSSPGSYSVSMTVTNAGGSSVMSRTIFVGSCSDGGAALCLNGGRFRAEAVWSVPTQNASGTGTAVTLTPDTGYFWFFSSNNVELVVKVLDGRAVNGRFWVFSGALTDVEYTLRITDTKTGAVQSYFNPQGTLSSFSDANAFAPGAILPGRAAGADGPAEGGSATRSVIFDARDAASSCQVNPTTLCVHNGRFQARVAWEVPSQGTSGSGTATTLTADTGHFWFFSPNNVEIVLKVVDGRAFNGKFWVFAGSLSDVKYTITVTDTLTGQTNTYVNPSGALKSFSDVSAF